jgi:DNA-binding NarL/FixJ family response regulator
VRLGLKAVLDQEGSIQVCAVLPVLELESCLLRMPVDVLVLDLDGLCFPLPVWVRELRCAFPAMAWVVCADGVSRAVSLLEAGVSGIVTTAEAPQLLALAIGACQAGQRFLSPPAATALLDWGGVALFGCRMTVLRLMADGRGNAEIGEALGFSLRRQSKPMCIVFWAGWGRAIAHME